MSSHILGNRLRRHWLATGLGGLAGLAVGGVLVASMGPEPPELAERRAMIADLSADERDRLERNFQRFEQLDAQQQQELREVYETTKEDPQLARVAENYFDWVRKQSPWQRESLRAADKPRERVALVEEFQADEDRRGDFRGRFTSSFESVVGVIPTLSAKDLEAVMAAMTDSLDVAVGKRQQLAEMHPLVRYQQIFTNALQREADAVGNAEHRRLFSGETVNRIVWSVSDPAVHAQFSELASPLQQKVFVIGMLLKSLGEQWRGVFAAEGPELRQYFEQLAGPQKDRLLAMPYNEQKRELLRLYSREKLGPDVNFFRLLQQLGRDAELASLLPNSDRGRGDFRTGGFSARDSGPSEAEPGRIQERRFGERFPRNRPGVEPRPLERNRGDVPPRREDGPGRSGPQFGEGPRGEGQGPGSPRPPERRPPGG